ncbi:pyridoxamine 5'-phosphate oxidase family protein [Streptomyces atratus]|uniref:pyridoxamine 5'-phosphate oxidase family protein n=1 Tax=Streptomyces atratus TaxID=1893 RepID=UPI0026C2C96C
MVAFEADENDPVSQAGWSVIVTGTASLERDPGQVARWRRVLTPWTGGQGDCVVRVRPDLVTGYRLLRPPAP